MGAMIELAHGDDFGSLQRKLDQFIGAQVILVLPWDLKLLSRDIEYERLWREAERRRLEIAIISPDPDRRQQARGCGFPAFATAERAASARWVSDPPESVEPPPKHWWEEEIPLQPQPAQSRPQWFGWLGIWGRLAIFAVALLVLAITAYVVVPSGDVTLVPAGEEFVAIVPVSVILDAEGVDHDTRSIPAKAVGVEVEGSIEIETTGLMDVYAGRSTGEVVFTNLLAQDYRVPVGTVVRTSSTSYPIRFRTTEEVIVPAGGQATGKIEAMEERVGNVAAYQINQVEGVAASAVRVINPSSTTGAEPTEARVVTSEDYDRARALLRAQLTEEAYVELGYLSALEPTEFVLRESITVVDVRKEAFDRFVTEQADTVKLNMRLLFRAWAVDADNAESIALTVLSQYVPPDYELLNAGFEFGEEAEERIGVGEYTLFVTAQGYADATLDKREALDIVRGRRLAEAQTSLMEQLPLAEEPEIALWPEWPAGLGWLARMPLIPLRIDVQVVPQSQVGE